MRSEEGRQSRLYPTGIDERDRRTFAILHYKAARKILRALADSQGLTNDDLSHIIHFSRSSVSEYSEWLREAQLLKKSLSGDGRIIYEIQDRERVVPILALFERNLFTIATESFIDLWEI